MNAPAARLLVVDDEAAQMRALCDTLQVEGYAVRGYSSARQALAELRAGDFDLLLTDLMMPEMDGIHLIAAAREIDPELGAIVMTGHGTIDTAVQAMRGGASDYILKPFKLNVVLPVLARALDVRRLRQENALLQEQERRRSEELAAAYQDLESFSYSVSHDLRAPLRAVDGYARILEEDYAQHHDPEGQRILHGIRDGGRRMDEMIVGLLSFSRATRLPLRKQSIDMDTLVKTVVAEELAVHEGPPARVEVGALPDAPGDPAVLHQVWANLVGNALKYSRKRAEPQVRIHGRTEGREAIYAVADNGAGFDPKYTDRLFGVFQRLHRPDDFPGTGVGLAIVDRIVRRHGGRISARGEPGAGACFEFTLPL